MVSESARVKDVVHAASLPQSTQHARISGSRLGKSENEIYMGYGTLLASGGPSSGQQLYRVLGCMSGAKLTFPSIILPILNPLDSGLSVSGSTCTTH